MAGINVRKRLGKVWRRCLGDSDREHWFWSSGIGNRICSACVKRLGTVRVSQAYTHTAPTKG